MTALSYFHVAFVIQADNTDIYNMQSEYPNAIGKTPYYTRISICITIS